MRRVLWAALVAISLCFAATAPAQAAKPVRELQQVTLRADDLRATFDGIGCIADFSWSEVDVPRGYTLTGFQLSQLDVATEAPDWATGHLTTLTVTSTVTVSSTTVTFPNPGDLAVNLRLVVQSRVKGKLTTSYGPWGPGFSVPDLGCAPPE